MPRKTIDEYRAQSLGHGLYRQKSRRTGTNVFYVKFRYRKPDSSWGTSQTPQCPTEELAMNGKDFYLENGTYKGFRDVVHVISVSEKKNTFRIIGDWFLKYVRSDTTKWSEPTKGAYE